MRTRTIVAIMAVAAALGVLTGRFVLPAHTGPAAPAASATSSPGPGPGPSTPAPPSGPVTGRNLVTVADFAHTGVRGTVHVHDRVGDGSYANAACAGEKTLGQTLGGPDAHFRGLLTGTHTDSADPTLAVRAADQVAREAAADAGSEDLARNFTARLLLEEVPCQSEPPGHWVYGPTHTLDLAAGVSASWMGAYDGDLNTTGAAPRDAEPCGGIAVLRNGSHYAVLEVGACLDAAAMTRVVRKAAARL
jgi:hypothetical protein